MKKCTKCKEGKPLTEFGKDSAREDNLNPWCKECKRSSWKKYVSSNTEKVKSSVHRRYHRDKVAISTRRKELHPHRTEEYKEKRLEKERVYRDGMSNDARDAIRKRDRNLKRRLYIDDVPKVYLVSDGEFIKIGYTKNKIECRLVIGRQWNPRPLEVLLVIEANIGYERFLHKKFSHLVVSGEWFLDNGDIAEFIKNNSKKEAA